MPMEIKECGTGQSIILALNLDGGIFTHASINYSLVEHRTSYTYGMTPRLNELTESNLKF